MKKLKKVRELFCTLDSGVILHKRVWPSVEITKGHGTVSLFCYVRIKRDGIWYLIPCKTNGSSGSEGERCLFTEHIRKCFRVQELYKVDVAGRRVGENYDKRVPTEYVDADQRDWGEILIKF